MLYQHFNSYQLFFLRDNQQPIHTNINHTNNITVSSDDDYDYDTFLSRDFDDDSRQVVDKKGSNSTNNKLEMKKQNGNEELEDENEVEDEDGNEDEVTTLIDMSLW